MDLLIGFFVYVVSVALIFLFRSSPLQECRYHDSSTSSRFIVATVLGWVWWSIGMSLIPLDRLAAWLQYGGIWVTIMATSSILATLGWRNVIRHRMQQVR